MNQWIDNCKSLITESYFADEAMKLKQEVLKIAKISLQGGSPVSLLAYTDC